MHILYVCTYIHTVCMYIRMYVCRVVFPSRVHLEGQVRDAEKGDIFGEVLIMYLLLIMEYYHSPCVGMIRKQNGRTGICTCIMVLK